MADVCRVQCKVCGKEFKLRPNQLGREVRCPYCKAICKILPQTETAREAAEALRGEVPEHRPVTTHRQVVMPRGGVRHRSVASSTGWVIVCSWVRRSATSRSAWNRSTAGTGSSITRRWRWACSTPIGTGCSRPGRLLRWRPTDGSAGPSAPLQARPNRLPKTRKCQPCARSKVSTMFPVAQAEGIPLGFFFLFFLKPRRGACPGAPGSVAPAGLKKEGGRPAFSPRASAFAKAMADGRARG